MPAKMITYGSKARELMLQGVNTMADAVKGQTGTLSFTWKDVKGLADKSVSIADCSVGGYDAAVSRDAASTVTLPFIAESTPDIT